MGLLDTAVRYSAYSSTCKGRNSSIYGGKDSIALCISDAYILRVQTHEAKKGSKGGSERPRGVECSSLRLGEA